jgi:hypothetical protein
MDGKYKSDPNYREIIRTVASKKCILFAGAGLSHNAAELPLWDELVLNIAKKFKDFDGSESNKDDLMTYKLEYLEWRHTRNPMEFEKCLQDLLKGRRGVRPIHRDIANLSWKAVITTNFDTLLEDAFDHEKKAWCPVEDEKGIYQSSSQERIPIIKLHGSISPDAGRVLTASDYQRFDVEKDILKNYVLNLLVQHPVLFIGAGLNDPNFAKLFRLLQSWQNDLYFPCFYVSSTLPDYVRAYWSQKHHFNFLTVEHASLAGFVSDMRKDVGYELKTQKTGLRASLTYSKEVAVKDLAEILLRDSPNVYRPLHQKYITSVHSPDYQNFSMYWEDTLYKELRGTIVPLVEGKKNRFGYIGPGAHAPFFSDAESNGRLEGKIEKIFMIDVLRDTLEHARKSLSNFWKSMPTSLMEYDITGGLGDRWCLFLRSLLKVGSLKAMEDLSEEHLNTRNAWQFETPVAEIPEADRVHFLFSEMVASFTGTPPLMAFHRALKDGYGKNPSSADLDLIAKILRTVKIAWQRFNDSSYQKQMFLSSSLLMPEGQLVVVVDTEKVFQAPGKERLESFFDYSLLRKNQNGNLKFEDKTIKSIWWNDHPYGIPPEKEGMEIETEKVEMEDDNFLTHLHKVETLCFRKA